MGLKENLEFFECFVKDEIWRSKIADLFSPEWDADGSKMFKFLWDKADVLWGESGVDLIIDFISGELDSRSKKGNTPQTIEELWNCLNRYYKGEDYGE